MQLDNGTSLMIMAPENCATVFIQHVQPETQQDEIHEMKDFTSPLSLTLIEFEWNTDILWSTFTSLAKCTLEILLIENDILVVRIELAAIVILDELVD